MADKLRKKDSQNGPDRTCPESARHLRRKGPNPKARQEPHEGKGRAVQESVLRL